MTEVSPTGVTCEKTTAEVYKLRGGRCSWADITICQNPPGSTEASKITVVSDWGNYGDFWRQDSLKDFLLSCDYDYIRKNLGKSTMVFDEDKTIKTLKQEIIASRMPYSKRNWKICGGREGGNLEEDEARECWYWLEHEYSESKTGEGFFYQIMGDTPIMKHLFNNDCHWAGSVYAEDWPGMLKGFMKHVWPEFMRVLKEERDLETLKIQEGA